MSFLSLAQDIDTASEKVAEATKAQMAASDAIDALQAEQEAAIQILVLAYRKCVADVAEAQAQLKALSKAMHDQMVSMGFPVKVEEYVETPRRNEVSGKDMKALIQESKRITGNR